uniref:DUF1618 domain-containing protein n=1 Tax=Setaria viridis TaxID=4556 RepID=A0A4U6STA2_SETVI|nr:hypothetical protein SEVIR_9G095100v2 [Setaria viridis]
MPKVKATGDEEGERSSKRRRTEESPPPQQHLYLILDDWKLGYSIRKIDARRELPMFFATALGSRIVAMHPKEDRGNPNCGGAFFDVHTACLNFIPRHAHAAEFMPIYFSIGNKRLALGCSTMDDPSFQLDSLSWRKLPDAPFDTGEVMSYATLHDKQTITIFASVGLITEDATFSFQMAADGRSPVWRHNGEWTLPFHGPGYFVPSRNAWVGLSMYSLETGHICACDLVSASSGHGRCPSWKFSKEKLFSDDPTETHVGATLVYTGQGSRFCLLECVIIYYKYRARPYNLKEKDVYPQAFRYLYRVTTFSLRYDENGDLTTGGSRRVRYYEAPKGDVTRFVCENPVAFWM